MRAKKSFGQHFLNREDIAERIADSLQSEGYKHVVEVGPGKGFLTKYLLEKDYQLKVVEADKDMVAYLNVHFPALAGHITFLDFLKVRLDKIFEPDVPFAVIGNYPYNISSQIIFKILDYKELVPEMVGMFQKEMAERIVAKHGSKTYSVIGVLTQAYYEAEYLFTVDKSCFSPPPKVQSGIIRLVRRKVPLLKSKESTFKKVVKLAFSQRRKMLRNTLKPLIKDTPMVQEEFFTRRPEHVSLEEFVELARRIEELEEGTNTND